MSRLEELIEELCPDGVEYKKLNDVCNVLRGKRLTKSQLMDDGKYPVLHGGTSPMGYYNEFNRKANTTVVVNTGNAAGCVFFYDKEFWSSDACFSLYPSPCVLDRYLYHVALMNEPLLRARIRTGAMPTIDSSAVEGLLIPVPPLEVQREIVRILDNFTELTEELTEELTARKQQYEYYRNEILRFDSEEVDYKPVKSIYRRIKGTPITAAKMKEIENPDGEIKIFAGGKTVINANETDISNANITRVPAVLVQSRGIIDVIYYDKPFTFKNEMWAYTADDEISVKFLYYILKNNIQKFRDAASGMGSMPQISLPVTEEFMIPVPSLDTQKRVVQILDYFDTICNDLSSGLPAEIEARQKQYEYYRDKLLTFKEKTA